jgi:enoyl-CoA hydratase/carnithine racemase
MPRRRPGHRPHRCRGPGLLCRRGPGRGLLPGCLGTGAAPGARSASRPVRRHGRARDAAGGSGQRPCPGRRLGVALACDILIAADDVEFGTPEVKVGLWPYMISALIVEHLGPKRAMELMMTGRRLTAAQARDWGLVNVVVPRDELDDAVASMAEQLVVAARRSPCGWVAGHRAGARPASGRCPGVPARDAGSQRADRGRRRGHPGVLRQAAARVARTLTSRSPSTHGRVRCR